MGGQSAVRIARLAEETRHKYVTKIVDYLNMLYRDDKTLLFGSKEITGMILENKTLLQKVEYKEFLEFNTQTINNISKWCKYLDETKHDEYDNYYEEVINCLQIDIDKLDFDITNKEEMKYYLIKTNKEDIKENNKKIPFPNKENKYYEQLCGFEYIGIKYYALNNDFYEE